MNQTQRSKLLKAYNALPADLQTVVNLLAVYHGYCSLTNIAKGLAGLGIKEGNRVLKSETVKARLRPLIATGLLDENARPGGIRCARGLIEVITRKLVTDQEFEMYAAQVLALNPAGIGYYRYNTSEDCIREARIQFYRGDYQKMQSCLDMGGRYPGNLPSHIDLYASWFLNPSDVEWFQQHHSLILKELAGYAALHQLVFLYRQPELDAFFLQQLQNGEDRSNPAFNRWYLELKVLRGEWDEVAAMLVGVEQPEMLAIEAMMTFLVGDHAEACRRYENALAVLRKLTGQRANY
ncbi:MAG: ATP-dependent helicase, partial [Methylomonas sp.]|nr:ATP-dependent helicase [Methylomonas sp.]